MIALSLAASMNAFAMSGNGLEYDVSYPGNVFCSSGNPFCMPMNRGFDFGDYHASTNDLQCDFIQELMLNTQFVGSVGVGISCGKWDAKTGIVTRENRAYCSDENHAYILVKSLATMRSDKSIVINKLAIILHPKITTYKTTYENVILEPHY